MTTKNHYKAQALAIIMIILIISSMIGFAVLSRSQKAKRTAIQERNSAEAYQVADMILDNLLLSTLEDWLSKGMDKKPYYTETQFESGLDIDPLDPITGKLIKTINAQDDGMEIQRDYDRGSREITVLTGSLGNPLDLQNLNICSLREHAQNEYRLSLTTVPPNGDIAIEPGQTFTFLKENRDFSGCRLNITVKNGDNNRGLVTNIISQNSDGIVPYDYDHTTSYKFGNSANFSGNWTQYNKVIEIPLNNNILAVQLTAVNERIVFSFNLGGCNNVNWDVWILKASANCGGTYRAKEVVVPAERYTHSIFNYVFFNGLGNIGTN